MVFTAIIAGGPSGSRAQVTGVCSTSTGPTATATYQYGTPPNAPTQVNAVASDGQAVINWLASTINGAPVTNYTVTATGVPSTGCGSWIRCVTASASVTSGLDTT